MNNPIITEVRRVRDEHARKFKYDLSAICADIREHQKTCGHPVVTLYDKNGRTLYPMPESALMACREKGD
jgi:DUF438 domain-containing protein